MLNQNSGSTESIRQ